MGESVKLFADPSYSDGDGTVQDQNLSILRKSQTLVETGGMDPHGIPTSYDPLIPSCPTNHLGLCLGFAVESPKALNPFKQFGV